MHYKCLAKPIENIIILKLLLNIQFVYSPVLTFPQTPPKVPP